MRAFRAAPARAQSSRIAFRSIRAQQGIPQLRAEDGARYKVDKVIIAHVNGSVLNCLLHIRNSFHPV